MSSVTSAAYTSLEALIASTGSSPWLPPLLCSRVLFGRDAVAEHWAEVNPRTMPSPQGQPWFNDLVEAAKGKAPVALNSRVEEIDLMKGRAPTANGPIWPGNLGERLKGLEGGGETRTQMEESDLELDPETKSKRIRVVTDTLGWYCPAHHYAANTKGQSDWGVYCPPEGVAYIAHDLLQAFPALSQDDAILVAALKLYYHECAHGLMEDLVFLTESVPTAKKQEQPEEQVMPTGPARRLQRTRMAHLLEEAFCNTVALSCLRRDFEFKDSRVDAVIGFMAEQGPGYSWFAYGIPAITNREAQKALAGMAWAVLDEYGPDAGKATSGLKKHPSLPENFIAQPATPAGQAHRAAIDAAITLVFGVVLPAEPDATVLMARRPWSSSRIPVIIENKDATRKDAPGSTRWFEVVSAIPGIPAKELAQGFADKGVWKRLPNYVDTDAATIPFCFADLLGEALTRWQIRHVRSHWAEIKPYTKPHPYALHLAASLGLDDEIREFCHPAEKAEDLAGFLPIHYAAIEGRTSKPSKFTDNRSVIEVLTRLPDAPPPV